MQYPSPDPGTFHILTHVRILCGWFDPPLEHQLRRARRGRQSRRRIADVRRAGAKAQGRHRSDVHATGQSQRIRIGGCGRDRQQEKTRAGLVPVPVPVARRGEGRDGHAVGCGYRPSDLALALALALASQTRQDREEGPDQTNGDRRRRYRCRRGRTCGGSREQ